MSLYFKALRQPLRESRFHAIARLLQGLPDVPLAILGVFAFAGSEVFLSVFKFADNGSITQNLTTSGNYTVHSDCTGSISFTSGDAATVTFNTVIIGGWTEVFCIQTNSGTVANLDARKQ